MTDTDTKNTSETRGGGNTTTPPQPDFRGRKWAYTLNNYTDTEYTQLLEECKKGIYIIGKEGEGKTPHLQGYVEFKNAKKFSYLKKISPKAHWEKAKGNKDQNYEYCSKEGNFVTNISPPNAVKPNFIEQMKNLVLEKEYKDVVWKPFQQNIINIINEEPHQRTIHWFWETEGNVGKTYLCKWLCIKYDIVMCVGSRDNILNQVLELYKQKKYPKIIIMDIPRSSLGLISYQAIEMCKSGCIYSGKYEGGICIYPRPHVICLSNEKPDETKLSADVWNIVNITASR